MAVRASIAKRPPQPDGARRTPPRAEPRRASKEALNAKQRAFLAALPGAGGILVRAAEAAGVDPTTHSRWLRASPVYAEAFAEANEQAIQRLEAEAVRRAVDGVERRKIYQGKEIMIVARGADGQPLLDETGKEILIPLVERDYSDLLLIFMLKAKRPEVYRERYEVSQNTEGTLRVDLDTVMSEHGLARVQAIIDGVKGAKAPEKRRSDD